MSERDDGTVVPYSAEAEKAVLGSMMQMPKVIDDVVTIVKGSDFYQPRHEHIWDAILAVHADGHMPDMTLVAGRLGSRLQEVGGAPYLHDLISVETCPAPFQAPLYARTVADTKLAREMVGASATIRQRAESGGDMRVALEDARGLLDALVGPAEADDAHTEGAPQLVTSSIDALSSPVDPGIATGWPDLDDVINGLRPGQLVIVGARPSVGKSVVGVNMLIAAARAGVGVHLASAEMTKAEVMNRIYSAAATIDLTKLFNHRLDERDWERLQAKVPQISDWPFRVDDQPQSVLRIRSEARTSARRLSAPLGMVVVDYMQIVNPRDPRVPREQQVGEISGALKALAKELRVPVIALAQLNRSQMQRQDKRPQMSDLRESGRIEADADIVLLLHREDQFDPGAATGEIEIFVAKNRNGMSGRTVRLAFQGHYSRAVSMYPTSATA